MVGVQDPVEERDRRGLSHSRENEELYNSFWV